VLPNSLGNKSDYIIYRPYLIIQFKECEYIILFFQTIQNSQNNTLSYNTPLFSNLKHFSTSPSTYQNITKYFSRFLCVHNKSGANANAFDSYQVPGRLFGSL